MGYSQVVEYELTDYSDTPGDVLQLLSEWEAEHRKKIRQSLYDMNAVAN